MGRKKATGTFYFEPDLLRRLKALSERTKVPQSVYVRDAVEQRVADEERRLGVGEVKRSSAGGHP